VWLAVCAVPLLYPIYKVLIDVAEPVSGATVVGIASPRVVVIAVTAWASIAGLLLARVAWRQVSLWSWSRRLPEHLAGLASEVNQVAREVGVRSIRVARGEAGAMPVCFGARRSTIVLPTEATAWPADLRRSVVLHECAHIAQGDGRAVPLIEGVVALLWFHPAVWLAAARIRAEGERACDDRVIETGVDPFAYATQLLTLARGRPQRLIPAAALLGRRELEERIAALLIADSGEPVRTTNQLGGHTFLVVAAVLATLVVTPRINLSALPQPMVSPASIPGSHPGSFSTTLFGTR
jgi:beta-lactamase regulating signal transducer with metallopeptidase domain